MGPLSAEDLQQLKEAGASAPLIQAVDEMAGRAREEVAEELVSSTGLGDEGPVATRVISGSQAFLAREPLCLPAGISSRRHVRRSVLVLFLRRSESYLGRKVDDFACRTIFIVDDGSSVGANHGLGRLNGFLA